MKAQKATFGRSVPNPQFKLLDQVWGEGLSAL